MLTNKLPATIVEPSLPLAQKSRNSLRLWGVLMLQNGVKHAGQKEDRQYLKVKV
jgi:hypothetical protein